MSFDTSVDSTARTAVGSQSLSIRAMSFDLAILESHATIRCLNPFRSGRCLSTRSVATGISVSVGLNPFRSGRCLSTNIS